MAATLAGRTRLAGIARWAKKLTVEQLREFDIKRKRGPCHSAMHNLFSRLSVQEVEGALGEWSNGLLGDKAPGRIAVDGKTLCASKGAEYPALHLLAAAVNGKKSGRTAYFPGGKGLHPRRLTDSPASGRQSPSKN